MLRHAVARFCNAGAINCLSCLPCHWWAVAAGTQANGNTVGVKRSGGADSDGALIGISHSGDLAVLYTFGAAN